MLLLREIAVYHHLLRVILPTNLTAMNVSKTPSPKDVDTLCISIGRPCCVIVAVHTRTGDDITRG